MIAMVVILDLRVWALKITIWLGRMIETWRFNFNKLMKNHW